MDLLGEFARGSEDDGVDAVGVGGEKVEEGEGEGRGFARSGGGEREEVLLGGGAVEEEGDDGALDGGGFLEAEFAAGLDEWGA